MIAAHNGNNPNTWAPGPESLISLIYFFQNQSKREKSFNHIMTKWILMHASPEIHTPTWTCIFKVFFKDVFLHVDV